MSDKKMMGGVVVLSWGCWGWGETLAEAKVRHRSFGGKLTNGYAVYTFTPETDVVGVAQGGYLHYNGTEPTETIVKPRSKRT